MMHKTAYFGTACIVAWLITKIVLNTKIVLYIVACIVAWLITKIVQLVQTV